MSRLRAALQLAALVLLAAASAARAEPAPVGSAAQAPAIVHPDDEVLPEWGRGPLEVQEPYILALYRSRPWATSPAVPKHLGVEVALRSVWANSYAFETGRFAIDAETRHLLLAGRLGIGDRFSLGAQLEYQWRGGGRLDGFIEDFHTAFGLPGADRKRRPRDRYLVSGLEADGSTFVTRHAGYGFADLVVEGRAQLLRGGPLLPALTATVRLRAPTGRGKFHLSDGVDPTLQLDLSKRLGASPVILYAGGAYTYHAEGRIDGLELYRHRGFGYVGAEVELGAVSLVAHVWTESPRERQLWRDTQGVKTTKLLVGNVISYVAFGVKVEPVEGLVLELGALENIVDPETTADFAVMFNLTLRM